MVDADIKRFVLRCGRHLLEMRLSFVMLVGGIDLLTCHFPEHNGCLSESLAIQDTMSISYRESRKN